MLIYGGRDDLLGLIRLTFYDYIMINLTSKIIKKQTDFTQRLIFLNKKYKLIFLLFITHSFVIMFLINAAYLKRYLALYVDSIICGNL